MDKNMKEKLQSIDNEIVENNMRSCLYIKEGKTLRLLKKSNKRRDINDYLDKMKKDTCKLVVIQHMVNTGKFLKGPINIICEIHNYEDGKRIKALATNVYYTIDELENRGFKWEDYKRIFNKLNRNLIPETKTGKLPTISDVDK